jgi:cytochrome c-type biogenesis protein CcmF
MEKLLLGIGLIGFVSTLVITCVMLTLYLYHTVKLFYIGFNRCQNLIYNPSIKEETIQKVSQGLLHALKLPLVGNMAGMSLIIWTTAHQDTYWAQTYLSSSESINHSWTLLLGSVWSNHEGSLLLWITLSSLVLYLGLWPTATWLRKTKSLWVVMGIHCSAWVMQAWIILYVGLVNQPLVHSGVFNSEGGSLDWISGLGLTAVLQDMALAIHPPLLFLGFTLSSLVWVYTMAYALFFFYQNLRETNSIDLHDYIKTQWTQLYCGIWIAAWIALTAGLAWGSWWAYAEIGWGGLWFWDPVENVGLIPWLLLTLGLHKVLPLVKQPNLFLLQKSIPFYGLFIYPLLLFCTWGVRSGLFTSVHAFAEDASRSFFLLSMLGFFCLYSLTFWSCLFRLLTNNKQWPIKK